MIILNCLYFWEFCLILLLKVLVKQDMEIRRFKFCYSYNSYTNKYIQVTKIVSFYDGIQQEIKL